MFELIGIMEKVHKGGGNLKITPAQKPTVPVMAGRIMWENPPCQPTPRRAALASAIKSCKPYEQWDDQCKNILGAWPQSLY